jgi:hypothetical protein
MSSLSARDAVHALKAQDLEAAQRSPSSIANRHDISVADAIEIIAAETRLRKSHKLWRK